MASKADKAKKAAEAAAKASPGIRKKLEALVKKAQEALKGGVSEKIVKGATATVRGGVRTPAAIKNAERKLFDAITRTKRYKSGQHANVGKGGGWVPGKKGLGDPVHLAKQVTARAAVYGSLGTGAYKAGESIAEDARNKAAEIAKAEAEEREKRRGEDAKAAYDQAMIDREKRKAAREKAAARKTNGNGETTSTTRKGGGKKDGRVLPGIRPFGGAIAKVLLGKDEKFGGDKGLIDFLRPSEWGKDKEKKVAGKKRGGEVKGYKKGGAVKTAAKNASTKRSKPRGVGAAKRGYGKAMR